MKCFVLISASLFFSWISVSESQSQTVGVLPGDDITLQCPIKLTSECLRFFFRLVTRTTVRCIFALASSASEPKFCDGYNKDNIEVSASISMFSLKIKNVNVFDSGMYFCGFYTSGYMNISVIHLNVKGDDQLDKDKLESGDQLDDNKSQKKIELLSVILGSLAVFLVMLIIGLAVTIRNLLKGRNEEQDPQLRENQDSGDMNYASVTFNPAGTRRRDVEPNVVYAATR